MFPAPAGMNRGSYCLPKNVKCVPRARGDEPKPERPSYDLPKCSPRPRG